MSGQHHDNAFTPARMTTGEPYKAAPSSYGAWSARCARCLHPLSPQACARHKLFGKVCKDSAGCKTRRAA